MIVVFVPDLLYSIKRAFDQNVISTYDLYSDFSTGGTSASTQPVQKTDPFYRDLFGILVMQYHWTN